MPQAYTEDQLAEQPAIGLFAEHGWAVAGPPPNADVAGEPRAAGLLGRETKGEVVLASQLRAALEWFNPSAPTARPQTSPGHRPRFQSANTLRAESPVHYHALFHDPTLIYAECNEGDGRVMAARCARKMGSSAHPDSGTKL